MNEPVPEAAGDAGPGRRTELAIGAALIALALVVWFEATTLPPPTTVGVGPSAAMRLVSVFVALLGVMHVIGAWRRSRSGATAPGVQASAPANYRALAWVLAALFGLIALLQLGAGFIAAATWLFGATARGFGARLGPKSLGAGVVLATSVYLFFTKALSLGLPAGPLERLFS